MPGPEDSLKWLKTADPRKTRLRGTPVATFLNQLLGYTAWRDTKTALLVFNRGTNMSTVLEGVAKTTRNHPSCKREEQRNSETEFRYVFGHRDDANRELTVTILVFDVPA